LQNNETPYAVNDDGENLKIKTNHKHSGEEEEEKLKSNNEKLKK